MGELGGVGEGYDPGAVMVLGCQVYRAGDSVGGVGKPRPLKISGDAPAHAMGGLIGVGLDQETGWVLWDHRRGVHAWRFFR